MQHFSLRHSKASTVAITKVSLGILTYGGVGSDAQFLSLDRRVGRNGDSIDFSMVR